MADLYFVPFSEFERLRKLKLDAVPHAELFASLCRINALYMIARAGSGHIGSSFSSMDILSWLYLTELRASEPHAGPQDLCFSSKGHDVPGQYAVLLGLGLLPFDLIHTLRRLGGLPGHPDVSTPGIVTNTGPLGMGISKAKGMVLANRLKGLDGHVYVITGDGELQEGQLWESLGSAANLGLGEITVIVDHNKIQSDTWVKTVSDLGDLPAKFRAFGWKVARCDGHDLKALSRILKRFRGITGQPKIIIADTIKGRGVSFMESSALGNDERFYRFHSGAPDDETYSRAVAELAADSDARLAKVDAGPLLLATMARPERPNVQGAQRLVVAYSRELVKHADQNPHLVALDADLELDCGLITFRERFPGRFIECGIAEQDMVSQAGGMALRGLLPVVHSFACFLSTRPNEQIYNNATEHRRIVYVASLAGLLPGGPGHSHQAVRDISALGSVPGLVMLQPSSETEVAMAADYCFRQSSESCYLRLVSIPCHVPYVLPADYALEEGRGVALTEGDDAVLFAYGPVMLSQAFDAASLLLRKHAVGLKVVNLPWLNRIDDIWLENAVGRRGQVFTVDDHYVTLGQGDMIAAGLARSRVSPMPVIHRLGVTGIPACGQNSEVLRAHGLDAEAIAETVSQALIRARA